jgi:hypothetical protein
MSTMSDRGNAATPIPSDTSLQLALPVWCPACRRRQPCARHLGTTAWQTTPIYTCLTCGQLIHETTPTPLAAAPEAPVASP